MKEQKIEGYWFEEPYFPNETPSPHPMPIPNVLSEKEAKEIFDLIVLKEQTAKVDAYRGFSSSRITGERLGSREYRTNDWLWPADFSTHYVLEHKVKPTNEFLNYIGYEKHK